MRTFDLKNAVEAAVIPWDGEYGVSYRTADGLHSNHRVGTRAQAEALVQGWKLKRDSADVLGEIIPFPKDVAAS